MASDALRQHGVEPRIGTPGGARDPFRAVTSDAAAIREAIRDAMRPFAARGANLKAIVTFDGNGAVSVAIEIRS